MCGESVGVCVLSVKSCISSMCMWWVGFVRVFVLYSYLDISTPNFLPRYFSEYVNLTLLKEFRSNGCVSSTIVCKYHSYQISCLIM